MKSNDLTISEDGKLLIGYLSIAWGKIVKIRRDITLHLNCCHTIFHDWQYVLVSIALRILVN